MAEKKFTDAFTLEQEEDGFRVYRRNASPTFWMLFKGDEMIAAAPAREAILDLLARIQNLRTFARAIAAPAY